MLLGYLYKLRPNQEQSAKIDSWLDLLRSTYNWSLADRINSYHQSFIQGEYCDLRSKAVASPLTCCIVKGGATGEPWKDNGKKRSVCEMQMTSLPELKKARPWYKEIDSTVLQQNLKRLEVAYKNFFSSNRKFPKFKNCSTFRSFTYTVGVKLKGNKIYLPKLGWIKYYNSRPLPDGFKIKSVTVRKKSDGYYVSIRIEDVSVPSFPIKPVEEIKTVIGLDMGLGKLIYCSDNSAINNPKFATNPKTKRLQRIIQRRVSRKKKRSNNRKKAQKKLSLFQHKIAQKREAYQWQAAQKIVNSSDAIAVEDLKISNMVKRCKPKYDKEKGRFLKNGQSAKRALNRLILDASWYSLIQKIEYLAAKSGKIVLKVNPKHTSQECSKCHHIDSSNRKGEKFLCVRCGHVDDANFQACLNIKNKAINQYQLKIKKRTFSQKKCELIKVGRDLPEPKQLNLFQTSTSELTGGKRRKHSARNGKQNVPGNLGKQLNLFEQENNYRASDTL
ncbi:transposase, IS605 OrfB family [Gloeothece citriformis PCC 7424]|uniref:Transposase, IS605 OrfB family n=1 Tax=Gloeothece citriformis (strain PCC 7424) TaxID=65393 RepID=B7KG41_GLOC7|nr:RNA-guided endonuclease TnpB family protein [Gloeothece citriformis]ACK69234.1 transposase, IS605 OrfB family [Gloeothece citriformis PCC 7424]